MSRLPNNSIPSLGELEKRLWNLVLLSVLVILFLDRGLEIEVRKIENELVK